MKGRERMQQQIMDIMEEKIASIAEEIKECECDGACTDCISRATEMWERRGEINQAIEAEEENWIEATCNWCDEPGCEGDECGWDEDEE